MEPLELGRRYPGSERLELRRRYTRSDPRGLFPLRSGLGELEVNRLGALWRPLVDMRDSDVAPMRLKMIRPVASWLADPAPGRRSWFSMIGVPGLRHQVLRHAGLDQYDCRDPRALPPELRTPRWHALAEAIERFRELDDWTRALVVFQLAQLSYCQLALELAGPVAPDGNPGHDHYAYEVARVHARYPGHAPRALATFRDLAASSTDDLQVLASCFQGIGHSIRGASDVGQARWFELRAQASAPSLRAQAAAPSSKRSGGWKACLVSSRFHRALALLRLAEGRSDEMRSELRAALHLHEALAGCSTDEAGRMVAAENRRYLLEMELRAAVREASDEVPSLCAELLRLDPCCVEARLVAGDAYAAIADYAEAARWYSHAGELGTGAGAVAWYRAGQCHDFMGDPGSAVNAMGRCLELDATAIEPRAYLATACARRSVSGSLTRAAAGWPSDRPVVQSTRRRPTPLGSPQGSPQASPGTSEQEDRRRRT